MIVFNCPACQKKYRVPDDFAGKKAKCKQCNSVMEVPFPAIAAEIVEDAATAQIISAQVPPQPVAAKFVQAEIVSAEAVQARFVERPKPQARATNQTQVSGEVLRGASSNFALEISQSPNFSLVTLRMEQGQKVYSEASAMATMTPSIKLKAGFKGGFGKTLGRVLGG